MRQLIRTFVGSYVSFAEVVSADCDGVDEPPRCRDPKEQMFLALADSCELIVETSRL